MESNQEPKQDAPVVVTVTLRYELLGNIEDAKISLASSFRYRQGRAETVSGCGVGGSYSAVCLDREPTIQLAK